MKFIKIILLLIAIVNFQSCLDLRSCSHTLSGKYICLNNPNAINYLELHNDGTFLHFYKENDTTYTDNGTWKKSEDGHCMLELSHWKNYNELGRNFENYSNGILWINGNYLDLGPDGETSISFKKEL